MKIAIVQSDVKWEKKALNLRKYEQMIAESEAAAADLFILPEMFSTGFTPNSSSLGEIPNSETFDWMMHIARKFNTGICGSYIVSSRKKIYNRLLFASPGSEVKYYDKRHLFRMNGVENDFTEGAKRVIVKFRGFRIFLSICYDLRFPVWNRNRNDYDLLINSANWPQARRDVWLTLLRARAIENMAYVAGANRTGTDGLGVSYSGDSVIIGPRGEEMANAGKKRECIVTAGLSIKELREFRKKFPAHKDADSFTLLDK